MGYLEVTMPKIVVTEESLIDVLSIIRNWQGKLTWGLLCEEVACHLSIEKVGVTRQTLSSYLEIQEAFTKRKKELRDAACEQDKPSESEGYNLEYWKNKALALEAQVEVLLHKNDAYKQRFIKWQYNAYLHGVRICTLDNTVVVDENTDVSSVVQMLENPLSEVNRREG